MKFDGHVGCVTRMNRLDFVEDRDRDRDLAYQWDTKCKLFSLVGGMCSTHCHSSFK